MKDKLLRIEFDVDREGKIVTVENMFAREPSRKRMWVKDLPAWIVTQINMLTRCEEKGYYIEGVGRKVSSKIFWVAKPPKEGKP